MKQDSNKVRTAGLPPYSMVRQLLSLWNNLSKADIYSMMKAIDEQTGTPQNPVDWSDPDSWISERLSGIDAEIARHIWTASEGSINPRHLSRSYQFINRYELLRTNDEGIYYLTDRGKSFLEGDSQVIRSIDEVEGIPQVLSIIAAKTQAQRRDMIPEWGEFLKIHSNFGTAATIKNTLHYRLINLLDRDLVRREGNTYLITSSGIDYATPIDQSPRRAVLRAINKYNQRQREGLKVLLSEMNPYRFEHLIRDLLEAMGYEDVVVTKESGDKGVDVVATVQFGITTIREVVQVKRHKGSIGRPILDQLRGSLPYHKAIRGTIITTGKFSKGCKEAALYPGAAPIGLIDGERLMDLLIEHEIGVRKQSAQLFTLDEGFFEEEVVTNDSSGME